MTDAEREKLLAALMDDGMCEFKAQLEVERIAADATRRKAVLRFDGTVGELRQQIKQMKEVREPEHGLIFMVEKGKPELVMLSDLGEIKR